MSYLDSAGHRINVGDTVTLGSATAWRVTHLGAPGVAMIKAHLSGQTMRRRCQAVTVARWRGMQSGNPDGDGTPLPGTELSCGCHVRSGDRVTILCDEHLALERWACRDSPQPRG